MCKLMLSTGCIVGLAYVTEFFMAVFSGNPYEQFVFINRCARAVRLGLLDHGRLQRTDAAVVLVPPRAQRLAGRVRDHHLS